MYVPEQEMMETGKTLEAKLPSVLREDIPDRSLSIYNS